MGGSAATYFRWKQNLGPSELSKMRQLEAENLKLKRLAVGVVGVPVKGRHRSARDDTQGRGDRAQPPRQGTANDGPLPAQSLEIRFVDRTHKAVPLARLNHCCF